MAVGKGKEIEEISPALLMGEASGSFEDRLVYLENKLATLQVSHNKEMALLRKAILIQLDMGEIYDESLYKNIDKTLPDNL